MPTGQARTAIMHFTDVDNLPGIVAKSGLLADAAISGDGGPTHECADASIKARRKTMPVDLDPYGVISDYVPFYFAPRSPMMYRIWRGGVASYQRGQEKLVYLVSSVEAVVSCGLAWIGSDGNCATSVTNHYNKFEELLQAVDWPLMEEQYWANTVEDGDRMRRRQAEFLIHRFAPIDCIEYAVAKSDPIAQQAKSALGHVIPVTVQPSWYY